MTVAESIWPWSSDSFLGSVLIIPLFLSLIPTDFLAEVAVEISLCSWP